MPAHLIFDLEKLHERSEEINPLAASDIIKELKAKLKKYKELYALSAPQIGFNKRIIAVKFNNDVIKVYVNPVILKADGYHLVREKDVSIAEKEFICPRPSKIHIRYQKENAEPEENFLYDYVAETFDRMQNYLDGVTLEDLGLEIIPEFDEASEEEQSEVIDMYLKSLKNREIILQESIDEDKDAKELQDAIKFMNEVEEGKIKLANSKEISKEDLNPELQKKLDEELKQELEVKEKDEK